MPTHPARAPQVRVATVRHARGADARDTVAWPAGLEPAAIADVPDDLVELGYVSDAYGIKGWIKIQPHASGGDTLLAARHWWLKRPSADGAARVEVQRSRDHAGTVVALLRGVADRNAAEMYKGLQVWVARSAFPPPDADEFYWVDLIGAQVSNLQGEVLGTVSGLIDNGAHAVLKVAAAADVSDARAGEVERLIPFVDAYVKEVDIAGRRIVVDWELDY